MLRRSAHRLLPVLAAALTVPGSASAAVTIGAPLDRPANAQAGCDRSPSLFGFQGPGSQFTGASSCTWLGADRIANPTWTSQVPRGQWVIVRVRVRAGSPTGPMAAVVLGNLRSQVGAGGGTICCRAMSESQVFTPAPNQVTQIDTRLPVGNTVSVVTGEPIETVDYLAISVLAPSGVQIPVHDTGVYTDQGSVRSSAWWPAMRTGQEQPLNSGFFGMYPLVQADLEPDADGDGFGDETQDSCSTDATIRARPVAKAAQCRAPVAVPGATAPPILPAGAAGFGPVREIAGLSGQKSVGVPILCPVDATGACAGTVGARTVQSLNARAAARKKLTLSARQFSVAPGRIAFVQLTLPAGARRELARRGRLALDVTVRQTAPAASTTTQRITVRRVANRAKASSGKVTFLVEDLPSADASKGAGYTLRAKADGTVFGTRFLTPRPGRVRAVTFTLNAEGRAALRGAGRLSLRLVASYTTAAGNPADTSRNVTVTR
ncbi:MAG: hypothetical protein JHC95_11480 [Solirubrobacteraceae bacterium]|nr:hypothetical protein [Solirubrobacteraceae bacterium]